MKLHNLLWFYMALLIGSFFIACSIMVIVCLVIAQIAVLTGDTLDKGLFALDLMKGSNFVFATAVLTMAILVKFSAMWSNQEDGMNIVNKTK